VSTEVEGWLVPSHPATCVADVAAQLRRKRFMLCSTLLTGTPSGRECGRCRAASLDVRVQPGKGDCGGESRGSRSPRSLLAGARSASLPPSARSPSLRAKAIEGVKRLDVQPRGTSRRRGHLLSVPRPRTEGGPLAQRLAEHRRSCAPDNRWKSREVGGEPGGRPMARRVAHHALQSSWMSPSGQVVCWRDGHRL
jgi:hypothetical protein